jgi:hypothetical protein
MRPDAPRVFYGIIASVMRDIAPEMRTPFGQQSVGLVSMLLALAAQDYDGAAARLVEENTAIMDLLGRSRLVVGDPGLHERIDAAVGQAPARDLRISALQKENDALRALLIDVHAVVEALTGEDARAMNEAVWDEIRQSTRRRHLERGPV